MFDSSAPAAYPQCYPCHDALRPRHRRAGPASRQPSVETASTQIEPEGFGSGYVRQHAPWPPAREPCTGFRHSTS